MVEEGDELANDGNFKAAVEKFRKANQWNSQLDIKPEEKAAIAFVVEGKELVRGGEMKEAIAAYNKALEMNHKLEISAEDWGSLCLYGAINKHAKDVMFACEKAVDVASKNEVVLYARGSRGIARALTGDRSGAIKDFEAFVKLDDDDNRGKSEVEGWLKELRNGKNPFTPEVLEKWRK